MDYILHPETLMIALSQVGIVAVYLGIFFIIFAESGLFFGFFFPGDSLLLTAGLVAFKKTLGLNLEILIPGVFICAALGDNVGYWFGNKAGPMLFKREESLLFKPRYLLKAKDFYERHGGITILVARFMPIIRTFAPIVAGAAQMSYRTFIVFNLIGAVLWGIGVTLLGYFLAETLFQVLSPEQFDKYFTLIILAAFFIPGLPTVWHLWKENKNAILSRVRRLMSRSEPQA